MARKKRVRRWPWLLLLLAVGLAAMGGLYWVRIRDTRLPVPGRKPVAIPEERITESERKALDSVLEGRTRDERRSR